LLGPVSAPFKVGTKVYLTNPGGKREGFTFDPTPVSVPLFGTYYRPNFDPDPGVFDKLDTIYDPTNPYGDLYAKTADGSFVTPLVNFGGPFNPDVYHLTVLDGTVYTYDQYKGLQQVVDPNGNTLTVSAAGIISSSGPSIVFKRDAQNHITEI